MKNIALVLTALLLLAGCTTISKTDFKPAASDTRSSPIVGRILVDLDGDDFTENCTAYWKFGNDNSTSYKLDSTGEVRIMMKPGLSAALTKIECRGFNTYTHSFWPSFPASVNGSEGELTYFGTIKLVWNTKWNLNPVSLATGLVIPPTGHDFLTKSGPVIIDIKNESESEFGRFSSQYGELQLRKRIAVAKIIELSQSGQ